MNKECFEQRKKSSYLIKIIDQVVYCYRAQANSDANGLMIEFWNALERVGHVPEIMDFVMPCVESIQKYMAEGDYVLLADYMELAVRPVVIQYMESQINDDFYLQDDIVANMLSRFHIPTCGYQVDEWAKMGYRLEYTSSGEVTLAVQRDENWYYLHSNHCSSLEDWGRGQRWREAGGEHYHVLGLGMGMHIVEMASHNPEVVFTVYESDPHIIELMAGYSMVSAALANFENVEIVYDPDYQQFIQNSSRLGETDKVCFHYPSISCICNPKLRESMMQIYVDYDNMIRYREALVYNFLQNNQEVTKMASSLRSVFQNKDVYVVAGGPSLDKNIDLLRKRPKNSVLFTVGTSLRRLLAEKTRPDYVMITDPKRPVYTHIKGLEDCNVPLIILSTTYHQIAKKYQGDTYIMYQKGFYEAERYAIKREEMLVESGSSVMTTALDYLIQMGAKRLVFLGLDMAFTGNRSHHSQNYKDICPEDSIMVESVDGDMVPTSRNLLMYKQWIERRIARESEIELIDATEGGAKIQGMKIKTMKEVLANEEN